MPSLDWLQNGALIMAVAGLVTAASAAWVNIKGHTQKALIETIGVLREEVKEAKARDREMLERIDEERERTHDARDRERRARHELSDARNEIAVLCDTIVVSRDTLTNYLDNTIGMPLDHYMLEKIRDRLTTARK